jgi:alcohol dehydrogenase class IV
LTGTAAIHALSFILSEEWHVPHGAACAFFAEDVFDHNLRDAGVRAKLAAVARAAFGAELAGVDEASALARLRAELVGLKRLTVCLRALPISGPTFPPLPTRGWRSSSTRRRTISR